MKLLSRIILLIFVVLLPLSSVVAKQQVAVVFDKPSATVNQFYKIISQKIHAKICHIDNCNLAKDDVAIVVGAGALESYLNIAEAAKTKVVAVYITQDEFKSIINTRANISSISAIYSDLDPSVQLKLAQAIYQKSSVKVGVLLSKETGYMEYEITTMLPDAKVEYIEDSKDMNHALNKLKSCEILLAIPDSNIYSNKMIKNIILTTYRRNQPIVGYSKGLVEAGVSASIYYDSEVIAEEVVGLISKVKNGEMLPAKHPTRFKVSINKQVVKFLDLDDISESDFLKNIGYANVNKKQQLKITKN